MVYFSISSVSLGYLHFSFGNSVNLSGLERSREQEGEEVV
jgi:hypothetical protein